LRKPALQGLAHVGLGGGGIDGGQLAALSSATGSWDVEPVAVVQVKQGQTALAPKPIRQARWWVLQHWPVSGHQGRPADAAQAQEVLVNRFQPQVTAN